MLLLVAGCAVASPDPDKLEILTVAPVAEAELPEFYRLVLRARPATEPVGPVELWIPLPVATTTLAWDVGPSVAVDVRDGVLHITSASGFPDVVVRAVVELPPGSPHPNALALVPGAARAEAGGRPLEVTLEGNALP